MMNAHLVSTEMLWHHRKLVQRTILYTDVVGNPRINPGRLKQIGHIHQKPDQPWM